MTNEGNWCSAVQQRLLADGFVVSRDVPYGHRIFRMVARRLRFEWAKGVFGRTVFIFGEFESVDYETVRCFASDAFHFAAQLKMIRPLRWLLYPVFRVSVSIYCYAVAMSGTLSQATSERIQTAQWPRHFGSAEILIVYDRTGQQLHYSTRTPSWAAPFYSRLKAQIKNYLEPAP